ncbi:host attachment protein [Alteromonas sp. ALT199]|uniref:host attachment protein n=1 Tax=unclassified Alteromonas TaxID=2614992 RepID=UPI00044DAD95|nr:host attachment protein [Alteromonas sp. ALT199]MBT3135795.1 host attachment protein [Alteromonas sp. ALT199]
MTVQKHYVIVANHDDATAYTYTNHGSALVEVKKWHNEFSGASDQDIYTDKPGRQSAPASQVPGVDSMNRKDAAELEDERFASDIADWLDGERKRGALGSIDIISGPGFLGKLRNGMSSQCTDVVDKEVKKNVLGADEETLLSYLK